MGFLAEHTLYIGDSGKGKSTLGRQAHETFDGGSFWANHSGETGIADSGARRDLRYPEPIAAMKRARAAAHQYVRQNRYPAQVVVDEAQDVMPDGDTEPQNPLKKGLHKDRDVPVKYVVMTQDPSDLAYTPLKQCEYIVWVGPPSPFHEGFARYFNIPRDNGELPSQAFEYTVFASKGDFEWEVVNTGETKAEYGD